MKPIEHSRIFLKSYESRIARNHRLKQQLNKRVSLFIQGQKGQPLNDHALKGGLAGYRAFSVTGDVRVIYKELPDRYIFIDVGTHAQIYK